MNVTTTHNAGAVVLQIDEPRLTYPILSDFAANWAYDGRWGPMAGYRPRAGEQMGFFLSAGDARLWGTVISVRERSNVVVVPLPAGDSGSWSW